MAVLTLAQIASHATRMAVAPEQPLSLVSEYVNLAYVLVARDSRVQHSPAEVLAFASTSTNTTALDNRVGFPSNYDYAIGLKLGVPTSWSTSTTVSRDTNWKPLRKVTPAWLDATQSGLNSSQTGETEAYAEYATWLELWPSPNSVYSLELRYVQKVSDLTLSTATPVLDEDWHWAIALKTAALLGALKSDQSIEYANERRFESYVNRVRTDQQKRLMDRRGARMQFQWKER